MKKTVLVAACILLSSFLAYADPQEVFGRSFMLIRPASYNIAMNEQLWHNFVYNKSGPDCGAFQLIAYYQRSLARDKVARYFLINRKNSLLVAGDATNAGRVLERDIRAEWLGLANDFTGEFSICPEQTQMGFTLMFNQDLKKYTDNCFFKDWSVGIEFPVLLVENDLNLSECDLLPTSTQSGFQPSIKAALNQCSWKYGKWNPNSKSKIRPEKIKFTAGRSLMHRDYFQLASSMSLSVPLAKKQNPEFIFDPVVGLDRHVGMGGAVHMQLLLNRDPECIGFSFFFNLEGTFFVRNTQMRTYDLKGKPFSRYMLYTRRKSPPGTFIPGVNVLTLDSVVRPFGIFDCSMGWRINTAPFEFEIGYDLYGFGGEKVELRSEPLSSPFNKNCGGLNEFGIAGTGTTTWCDEETQATASGSTIDCLAPDDDEFVGICENDLDLCSPAAGSILNHKVHAAFGVQRMCGGVEGFAGAGLYFEFPQKNAALANGGLWLKVGATY